ncbi:hypothetical protein [Tannerella forsythia]|uniref:hypothetical protein n=1 Tax=Tannerella forsythia TaxID=28112 RepID=UPI0028E67EC9|nr:hypothetical protein [Tannerella forsythia]
MKIDYGKGKDVQCYRDYVLNPDDRNASRAFSKRFGESLMKPAKKLHDRLKHYASAALYNSVYGSTDNRIEIKRGVGEKEPLILKVRIDIQKRKFFNHMIEDCGSSRPCVYEEWKHGHGDFGSVVSICIVEINNHEY